jgi:hypothetical protein
MTYYKIASANHGYSVNIFGLTVSKNLDER